MIYQVKVSGDLITASLREGAQLTACRVRGGVPRRHRLACVEWDPEVEVATLTFCDGAGATGGVVQLEPTFEARMVPEPHDPIC